MKSRMMAHLLVAAGVLWAPSLLLPGPGSAQEEHRLRGNDVAVYNLAGSAEIVAGSGSEVVVQVMRGGGDAARLDAEVVQVEGHDALVIHYPDDRIVYPEMGRGSRSQLRVRTDGTFYGDRGSGGAQEVRISGSGSGLEAWADLRISVPRGGEFALYLAVGETTLDGVDGAILVDTGSGAVVAHSGRGELSVDTGSGEVTVEGFDGEVELDTGSGSVHLREVRGGEVRVDTGSGEVVAHQVAASSVEVDTGSGGVDMRGISAPNVIVDTGSGNVQIELMEDVDRLEIDTGSGGVDIWVPASVGARVELETGSGGIDLDLPFEAREVKRDYVQGVLGDGRGSIVVDTGSGRIRLMAR